MWKHLHLPIHLNRFARHWTCLSERYERQPSERLLQMLLCCWIFERTWPAEFVQKGYACNAGTITGEMNICAGVCVGNIYVCVSRFW